MILAVADSTESSSISVNPSFKFLVKLIVCFRKSTMLLKDVRYQVFENSLNLSFGSLKSLFED